MRKALILLALVAASPAAARDKQDKLDLAVAVAAIHIRGAQIQADPSQAGCLGKDAVTCMASLARTIYIAPTTTGRLKLPTPVERDINGEPVSQVTGFLVTFSPKPGPGVGTHLYLDDGVHVDSVEFDLLADPLLAKTQADWDATHVFELATAVLGPECVGSDRLKFYRQYDAVQRREFSKDRSDDDYWNPTVSLDSYGSMKLCSALVVLSSTSGVSARDGSFGGSSMSFHRLDSKR
jgi:hypothetical protein